MTHSVKSMNLDDFRDQGLLQEVNRQFFHPLGLALAVHFEDGHVTGLANILETDDPEGWEYEWDQGDEIAKAKAVELRRQQYAALRIARWGAAVQPLPADGE